MTLPARLRSAARWLLAGLVAAAGLVLVLFRPRRSPPAVPDPIDAEISRSRQQRLVADARAAVEIAAARAVEGKERDELLDVLRGADEDQQNERLIEQARKLRGE